MQQKNGAPKRRTTRKQYEAMQRRKRQNMIAIAGLAAFAVILIVVIVLILRPKAPDVAVMAPGATTAPGEPTATPIPTATPEPTPVPTPEPAPEDAVLSVRMRFIGDIMVCESQLEDADTPFGYDFHDEFSMIADTLKDADYTLGNLETTLGKYKNMDYSGYPMFNSPETLLDTLKDAGVDFLTLANNHMLDRYFDGLKNTVNWVEQYGIAHVGAYRTQQERNTPVVYDVGGIKLGFVAYTLSTNTVEKSSDPAAVAYGVPYLDKSDFDTDIARLKAVGAEYVIAFPHWGDEYALEVNAKQKRWAISLAQAGADIIIGSHTHTVQPMNFYDITDKDGNAKRVFCMFSMGNFISDHQRQYTDEGLVLELTLYKHADGHISVGNVNYIPIYTWVNGGAIRVLPSQPYLEVAPAGMSAETHARLKETFAEVREIIGSSFRIGG